MYIINQYLNVIQNFCVFCINFAVFLFYLLISESFTHIPTPHPTSGYSNFQNKYTPSLDIKPYLMYRKTKALYKRMKWQPISVFLIGILHVQKSLVGCSP